MRIIYSGLFLQDGFKEAGCEITPLRLNAHQTLNELIEETGVQPDVVFIEIFGQTVLPKEIFNCEYRLALYCIDSPLNEYWVIPLAKLFDFVYVDQLSSVKRFLRNGVRAKWLPLFALKTDFRPPTNKKHLITFVGRITQHRIKRTNLIKYICKSFPVNIVDNVSRSVMIDIFASSRIVLNENFFTGLNLRFFQALASGSLLLTERHGYGVNAYFQEGRHYIGYSPDDVIVAIKTIEQSYEAFESIAIGGQQECADKHTSINRALIVIEDIGTGKSRNNHSMPVKKPHEAQSKYYHALRFGGNFIESVNLFKESMHASPSIMSHALCTLGSIDLRSNHYESGVAQLEKSAAVSTAFGLNANLKLLLLFSEDKYIHKHIVTLLETLIKLKLNLEKYFTHIELIAHGKDTYYNTCMLGYELLYDLHINYNLGFHKSYTEKYPDFAMEYAILAFKIKQSTESLNAIIRCTKQAHVAPEALEFIKDAILTGVASKEQIALSASLAIEYYDFSYAHTVIKALNRSAMK